MLFCCQRRHQSGARVDKWAALDHSHDITDKWLALVDRATEHRHKTLEKLRDSPAQPELRASVAVYPPIIYFTEGGDVYHIAHNCRPGLSNANKTKLLHRRLCKHCQPPAAE